MAESAWSFLPKRALPEIIRLGDRSRRRDPVPREPQRAVRHHRTIFISDVHLGTRGCKAETLVDFLNRNQCQTLYLVGDIVDGWRLKYRWFWPAAHSAVVQAILRKVDTGTRVIYVPGNHDEVFRTYCGREVAGIEIAREAVHETADGKQLLVIHGDQFDAVIAYAKWLAYLGDWAYTAALQLNEWCHVARRLLGLNYWSLSAYLKQKVKNALEYICRFEEAVADDVHARGFDGVVCGHIHHAAIKTIAGVVYHNDGDWVESCTALVEDARGHLEILRWADAGVRPLTVPAGHATDELPDAIPA
jgi:UDP-2,3-diacylglucosamine pyrophosphatase LpxH